jgi:hypothetical protein
MVGALRIGVTEPAATAASITACAAATDAGVASTTDDHVGINGERESLTRRTTGNDTITAGIDTNAFGGEQSTFTTGDQIDGGARGAIR